MKANDMLNQVKELLGMEVKVELAEMKLENGTVIEAEAFEAGAEVFIVTEDERVALPVGEYELEDGNVLVVTEEGIIAEIKSAEAEAFEADNEVFIVTEDEKVALPVGEYKLEDGKILVVTEEGIIAEIKDAEAEEEAPAEEEVEAAEEEEVQAEYVTKEELAEVVSMIEEIKSMIESKEEMSAEEVGNLVTEELAAQEKTELSEEPVQRVNHSPESTAEKKLQLLSQKRPYSTLDRVFNNLNK